MGKSIHCRDTFADTPWTGVSLAPPQLTYEDEGEPAYHTNFSWRELKSLLEEAGFVVMEGGTFAFFTGLHRIIGRILPRLKLGQYAFWLHRVEAGLAKVPFIRLLGTHWFVIAERRSANVPD